jgi:deazaflavin-dependent oxidoreductase (nitroreductase family)
MNASQTLMDITTKSMNVLHRADLKVSGGRIGTKLGSMATVELRTVGRKSGKPHNILLTSPIYDEGRVVLIASKGGDDRHPDWYRNLMAKPDTEIVYKGEVRKVHARTAEPEEKAVLWPQVVKAYRGYGSYQKRTDRDIPVVICELQ